MGDNKSGIDKLFDMADQALGGLEGALTQSSPETPKHGAVDAEFTEVWRDDVQWAAALDGKLGEAHHAFKADTLKALCGVQFNSADVKERKPLEHGKRIIACTTCIIEVSRV